MRVLVDTPIWSLALRRRANQLAKDQSALVEAWRNLIRERRIVLIGPVRQEILSGLREQSVFNRLRDRLQAFDDEPLTVHDYEKFLASGTA